MSALDPRLRGDDGPKGGDDGLKGLGNSARDYIERVKNHREKSTRLFF